jgi:hypothetical protein
MIFTDKPIKAKTILVRFYQYSDTEKGYGDAGTKLYARISLDKFECKEEERFDGTNYYTYSLNHEFAIELLGNYYWIGTGYQQTTEREMEEEKAEAEKMMKMLSTVKEY